MRGTSSTLIPITPFRILHFIAIIDRSLPFPSLAIISFSDNGKQKRHTQMSIYCAIDFYYCKAPTTYERIEHTRARPKTRFNIANKQTIINMRVFLFSTLAWLCGVCCLKRQMWNECFATTTTKRRKVEKILRNILAINLRNFPYSFVVVVVFAFFALQ